MQAPVSIMDSPLWINGESGHPYIHDAFVKGFNLFLTIDRFGGPFLVKNGLTLKEWYFAFADPADLPVASPVARPNPGSPPNLTEEPKAFPYMCAVPFTVTREMCNDYTGDNGNSGESAHESKELHMCTASVSLLTDMITSFHVYLAIHPNDNAHVSVSIQTNQCGHLKLGGEYVAVAKIDKLGRRIVFTSVDFMERNINPEAAKEVREAGLLAPGSGITHLKAVLPYCTVLATCKHVKSILSADAQKRVASTQAEVKKEHRIDEKVEPSPDC